MSQLYKGGIFFTLHYFVCMLARNIQYIPPKDTGKFTREEIPTCFPISIVDPVFGIP